MNQYGALADSGAVARLGWIYATWGATTDPARAVAIGVVTHAVMGDYPGLTVADLDPTRVTVSGGDPLAVAADVAAMWHASATLAGPYRLTIIPAPGPVTLGVAHAARVLLTGAGGGAEGGVAMRVTGAGATIGEAPAAAAGPGPGLGAGPPDAGDRPALTGPDGSVAFSFTPTATSMRLTATTATALPGADVTVWRPGDTPVPVQRVLTTGAGVTPSATMALRAQASATLRLVKRSADPSVAVGSGFAFTVAQPTGPAGSWRDVATRRTAPDGTIPPVPDLSAGPYRVSETAHPPAFAVGGPWTGTLATGQDARVELTDQVVARPVVITKLGERSRPLGSGVTFSVAYDVDGNGSYTSPVGTWTTRSTGRTATHQLTPGRYLATETTPPAGYLSAPPQTFTVAPVGSFGPTAQQVVVVDRRLPAPAPPVAATGWAPPIPPPTLPAVAALPGVVGSGPLAFTGVPVWRQVAAAGLLIGAGVGLVGAARRRRAGR